MRYLFLGYTHLMTAQIKRLTTTHQKENLERIKQLELFLSQYPEIREDKKTSILWELKKKTNLQEKNTWTFIMISPTQNDLVVEWLLNNSKRPTSAFRLWTKLFKAIDIQTGQIMLSRQEISKELNILPNNVSGIMSELESIGAIIKKKEGRGVIYYMNPHVGTHLPQEIREKTQKLAPKLKLLNGGLI